MSYKKDSDLWLSIFLPFTACLICNYPITVYFYVNLVTMIFYYITNYLKMNPNSLGNL